MLKVQGLSAHYGRAHILADVGFEVPAGQVVVLLGRNGAGKSTTLKAVMGMVRPTAGQVLLEGTDLAGREAYQIARAGLGYVPEERRIFSELTVRENLSVGRRPAVPGLRPWTEERLYGGEQQMLSIARTLMGNPRLLLLDEPSEGLAPVVVQRMAQAVRQLKAEGLSILLAEQNLYFAHAVADRAVIIEQGRIRWEGGMVELLNDESTYQQYLSL